MGKKAKNQINPNKNVQHVHGVQNHSIPGPKHTAEYKAKYPFVSICMPTFNRRPFFPFTIKCFDHQTYPKDRMEWIIIDDGTDKVEDLVAHIPQVKYFKYNEKMTLGKKRNLSHEKSIGEFIVYMDDDDYYPPERVSHAVETLRKNPHALCAGSSEMYIYFKHISKMYKFGPYGPTHATAATFAFRRELLNRTSFQETACVAEEKHFLKDYTIPFVQLDSMKTILVFSHNHNSFDKKELLKQMPNPMVNETVKTPGDFVKELDVLKFFMEDIDKELDTYQPGRPENKPDVIKQIDDLKIQREKMELQHQQQQLIQKLNEFNQTIQTLTDENTQLKEKVTYLEDKMKQLISEKIQDRIKLSQTTPKVVVKTPVETPVTVETPIVKTDDISITENV